MSFFGAPVSVGLAGHNIFTISEPKQITLSVTKEQMGPYLKIKFFIISVQGQSDQQQSETFNIDNLATASFIFKSKSSALASYILIKKHDMAMGSTVKVKITCQEPSFNKEWIYADDDIDNNSREIGELKCKSTCGNVNQYLLEAIICVSKIESLFAKLYEDNDFTDFYLSNGDDERIPVHKACLAVHSDVFKTMLIGKWTETASGDIKVIGVSLDTLKHLKQYIYLGTLPEEGLLPLLQISTVYLIENLKKQCIIKLAEQAKPEDLYYLLEFAFENKIPELTFAILLTLPDGFVPDAQQIMNKMNDNKNQDSSDTNNSAE